MHSLVSEFVRSRIRRCASAAVFAWVGLALPVIAAAADKTVSASEAGLEQIVVTARHVSESLQKAPLAITAFTGADLSARGIDTLAGLSRMTPDVTLGENTGGFGKSALAYIRGVGQYDAIPAFEPGVGFYVDDVYYGTLIGTPLELTDISRVEVLRGPQGTLFGKSNEGGAIRIFTPQPRGTNSGYAEIGYGSYNREEVRGAFDWGIVPGKLFLRVAGGTNSVDGYVKQVDFACAHPSLAGTLERTAPRNLNGSCTTGTLGGDSVQTGRIDLRYLPTDDLDMTLSADYTNDKGVAGDEVLMAINPDILGQNGVPWTGVHPTGPTSPYGIPFDNRFITGDHYSTYVTFCDQQNGLCFPDHNNMKSWGVSGIVNWNAPHDIHIKNVLAYRTYRGEFAEIWAAAPWQIDDNYMRPYHHQLSEELDISGTALDKALEWTVGGYYYHALTQLDDYIYIAFVPVAFDGYPAFYGDDPVRDEDRSGFLHGVYHLTSKLSLEAGLRYTDTTKQYTFQRLLDNPSQPANPIPVYLSGFDPDLVVNSGTKRFDYRAALQYQWTRSLMTYASFSTGFKGPGVNPRPTTFQFATPFKEENVRAFEIGAKTQWLDNRLRVDVDGYLSNYTDLQLSIPINIGGVPGSTISNAGKVRITGAEAEIEAEPIPRLLLNVAASYLNYDILDLGLAGQVANGVAKGDIAPYTPKEKISAGLQYAIEVSGSGATLTPRLDYSYQSKSYGDPDNNPYSLIPPYGLANLHLAYETGDSLYQVRLDVDNLFDRFYWSGVFSQYYAGGMVVGRPGAPRSFFLSIRRTF